ncbi:MAG: M48 family metallopeptidase [Gammaproteobacteria bacterium]|nr:M48 family metallopeptidase [Gammaproteobacteria bacterium]
MRHTIIALLSLALLTPQVPLAAVGDELPDLGDAGGAVISNNEEYQLGRMIMRQLRQSGALLDDPVVDEYVQALGQRLASHAHEGQHKFQFFVVRDPRINAFALPGGFIGIHHGLVLAAENESELASVLAHEVAHVTQKHIARMIESSGQTSLMTTAAILAAVIVGGATGADSDALQAAITVAQGTAIQSQINFTRANEYEADRVGIDILASAGFDPRAVGSFFETLSRYNGLAGNRVPDFLQTHPVTSERIAEARDRAALLATPDVPPSLEFELIKARLRVANFDLSDEAVEYFEARRPVKDKHWHEADRYGYAMALLESGRAAEAWKHLEYLLEQRESVTAYHIGLARAQQAAGDIAFSRKTYERAIELFPRNVPLTLYFGEHLVQTGDPERAHKLLLDLVNNVKYTQPQVRLLALAASAAGDTADAHYYMSEVHVLAGNLPLAVQQLELALASPELDGVQRARFAARLDEIRKHLPGKKRRRFEPREDRPDDDSTRSARR